MPFFIILSRLTLPYGHYFALTYSSDNYEPAVVILVGPERQRFTVHKAVLVSECEYFRSALDGQWQEAISGTFALPDENASVFRFFVHWLYGRLLDYRLSNDSFLFLIEAYLLAERRGARKFQNAVISEINKQWPSENCSLFRILNITFSETPAHSALRKLFIDRFAWGGGLSTLQVDELAQKAVHPDFAIGIYAGILARVRPGWHLLGFLQCDYGPEHILRVSCDVCCKQLVKSEESMEGLANPREAPYENLSSFCLKYHAHLYDDKGVLERDC